MSTDYKVTKDRSGGTGSTSGTDVASALETLVDNNRLDALSLKNFAAAMAAAGVGAVGRTDYTELPYTATESFTNTYVGQASWAISSAPWQQLFSINDTVVDGSHYHATMILNDINPSGNGQFFITYGKGVFDGLDTGSEAYNFTEFFNDVYSVILNIEIRIESGRLLTKVYTTGFSDAAVGSPTGGLANIIGNPLFNVTATPLDIYFVSSSTDKGTSVNITNFELTKIR